MKTLGIQMDSVFEPPTVITVHNRIGDSQLLDLCQIIKCSGGWNNGHLWNSNGRGLFSFPMYDKMIAHFVWFSNDLNHRKTKILDSLDHFMYEEKLCFILKSRLLKSLFFQWSGPLEN